MKKIQDPAIKENSSSDEKIQALLRQPKLYEAMKRTIAQVPEVQELFLKLCNIITQPPESMTADEFIASILIILSFWGQNKKESMKKEFS